MTTVAIVGVLSTLAIYGVKKKVNHARTTEARNNVGRLARDAAAAFERERTTATGAIAARQTRAIDNRLCTTASATVPSSLNAIRGRKYQSTANDWSRDRATAGRGFACLGFTVEEPQYYAYEYRTSTTNWNNAGAVNTTFDAYARGDLDGNGVRSEFRIHGRVVSKGRLQVSPTILESLPDE
jgi:type IV pilus assembly protein PilA